MSKKNIVLISDSTGETAEQIMKAVLVHFDTENTNIMRNSKVNTIDQIDAIFKDIKGEVIIFTTLIDDVLATHLKNVVNERNYKLVDLLGNPMRITAEFLDQKPKLEVGLRRQLSEDYFHKIECVEFTVKYDDGKDPRGIPKADIVIIGVSRTSKTPVSLNLAFKNYKVCNIPLIPELDAPKELFEIDPKKVIGLIIDPEKLNEIRIEKLKQMGLSGDVEYAADDRINEELTYALDIMNKVGCKIIDVTDFTIEETAKEILIQLDLLNNGKNNTVKTISI